MRPPASRTAVASRRNSSIYPLADFLVQSVSTSPAWAACLVAFERELTPQQFATWIRPLACADDGARLRLIAPNRFVLQWVKDRFGGRIETLARQATGETVAVEFAVADAAAATKQASPASAPKAHVAAEPASALQKLPGSSVAAPPPAPISQRRAEPGSLNPSFTFGSPTRRP